MRQVLAQLVNGLILANEFTRATLIDEIFQEDVWDAWKEIVFGFKRENVMVLLVLLGVLLTFVNVLKLAGFDVLLRSRV